MLNFEVFLINHTACNLQRRPTNVIRVMRKKPCRCHCNLVMCDWHVVGSTKQVWMLVILCPSETSVLHSFHDGWTNDITFRIGQSSLVYSWQAAQGALRAYGSALRASRKVMPILSSVLKLMGYSYLVCRDQPRGVPSVDPSILGGISPYVTRLPQVLLQS